MAADAKGPPGTGLPLNGIPADADRPEAVPASVAALARGGRLRAVWETEVGGRTFEILGDAGRRFVKWVPRPAAQDLDAEAERLDWAGRYTTVPRVLARGADDAGAWLVTAALPGESAVAPRWLKRPETAVRAIGAGLRAFHDALPVAACPYAWSRDERVREIEGRHAALDPGRWHPDHRGLGVEQALAALGSPPPDDRLVVCHGDACAPNTLIGDDGRATGHVDLGALGVADRWADLAVATWSTVWNYGPGFEEALLEAYGVRPDRERIAYYRLLWDLGP